jgi:hypothetical protein
MSLMTVCPDCKAQVGVPDGTHLTAQVRCPLCEVEFSFGESIPDDLPEVVVVDPGFVEPAAEEADLTGAAKAAEEASAQTAEGTQTDADAAVKTDDGASEETPWFTPDDGGEPVESGFSFDPFGDSERGDSDKDDAEKAADKDAEKEGGDVATADEDEKTIAEPSFSFSTFGDSDDHATDFGGASFGETSGDGEAGTATATAAKPKKKGMSLKGQIVGIVVFGVIGLGLGYGILKMVKPAAAAPFDKMFVSTWNSVASLWGGGSAGDQTASTSSGGGETVKSPASNQGSADDDGGFKIGGMLPQDQQPKDSDLENIGGVGDTGEPATDGATEDVSPPEPAKPTFRDLLGGLSDPAGVFKDVTFDEVDATITKASQEQGAIINRYLAMCDVGEKMANADNSGAQFENLSSACQALALISAESIGESNLENASYNWLKKRPAAYQDRGGIFLLGRVSKVRNGAMVSSLFATEIAIKKSASVILLTTTDPNLKNGDKVAVLGTLVEDAVSRLPGYSPTEVTDKFEGADPSNLVLGAVVVKP